MTAHSLDIRVRALGDEVASRNSILAPGLRHSRNDRNLSVTLDKNAPTDSSSTRLRETIRSIAATM
jgi:hypothetical protein